MISTVVRTCILYIVVTVAIRLMGKRQIGDMQPNELVVTLLISEIAAIPLQDANQPVINGIAAISVLIVLEIVVSVLAMKSGFIRRIMNGRAIVIIKNGIIDQQAMKTVRMTVLDLVEMLRSQEIFNIQDVAYAILEVNGELSVLLNSAEQPVTPKDMGIKTDRAVLPMPVVSDGRIIKDSLDSIKMPVSSVERAAKSKGVEVKDVFLMTADRNGKTYIIKKEDKK